MPTIVLAIADFGSTRPDNRQNYTPKLLSWRRQCGILQHYFQVLHKMAIQASRFEVIFITANPSKQQQTSQCSKSLLLADDVVVI